ncbi:cysteine-rich CWC family protein [Psychromonas arctica]|uniref:cysteine-rich CWC family protein n=1 Tax=Psychromonas arctica TaxID=168275 RepID=UPI002FD2E3EA
MSEKNCPLCLQENHCDVVAKQGCWCNKVTVPQALLDLIDEQAKNKHYICNVCISRFISDPDSFYNKQASKKVDLS